MSVAAVAAAEPSGLLPLCDPKTKSRQSHPQCGFTALGVLFYPGAGDALAVIQAQVRGDHLGKSTGNGNAAEIGRMVFMGEGLAF